MNTSFNKSGLLSSAVNSTLKNKSVLAQIPVPSKADGVALCSDLIFTTVVIVVGNLLTVVVFATNKRLRKKSLILVINMAFADLMLGAVTLPIYIYEVGRQFNVWTNRIGGLWSNKAFSIFFVFTDTTLSQASLISAAFISCERFYAAYWPFKHRTFSMRAYRIVIFMVWTLALFLSTVVTSLNYTVNSVSLAKMSYYIWIAYVFSLTFIICGCNISIWRKFQQVSVASQQQNRAALNKRLTKTLLFVSVLALLCWLPLIVFNYLFYVTGVPIQKKFEYMVNVLNYSNSFVNPVVYALRIPEFRQALGLCCFRRQAVINKEPTQGTRNFAAVLTPVTEPRTFRTNPGHLQLEAEVEDTKL